MKIEHTNGTVALSWESVETPFAGTLRAEAVRIHTPGLEAHEMPDRIPVLVVELHDVSVRDLKLDGIRP